MNKKTDIQIDLEGSTCPKKKCISVIYFITHYTIYVKLNFNKKGLIMPHNILMSKIRCYNPNKSHSALKNLNYIIYIGTRPGVDLTDVQLDELTALTEENIKTDEPSANNQYIHYIAKRQNSQGLFANFEFTNITEVARNVRNMTDAGVNVYRGIVSLCEEDAIALGYTKKEAWVGYMNSVMNDVGNLFGIPVTSLKWCAAVHMEQGHPHCHYTFWRTDGKVMSSYIHTSLQNKVREFLSGEMFKAERELLIPDKNLYRASTLKATQSVIDELSDSTHIPERITAQQLKTLSADISTLVRSLPGKGRLNYKLLPPECKANVNKIVDDIISIPAVHKEYMSYIKTVDDISATYSASAAHTKTNQNIAAEELKKRIANKILHSCLNLASIQDKLCEMNSVHLYDDDDPQVNSVHSYDDDDPQVNLVHLYDDDESQVNSVHLYDDDDPQVNSVHSSNNDEPQMNSVHSLNGDEPQVNSVHSYHDNEPQGNSVHSLNGDEPQGNSVHSYDDDSPQGNSVHSYDDDSPQGNSVHSHNDDDPQVNSVHSLNGNSWGNSVHSYHGNSRGNSVHSLNGNSQITSVHSYHSNSQVNPGYSCHEYSYIEEKIRDDVFCHELEWTKEFRETRQELYSLDKKSPDFDKNFQIVLDKLATYHNAGNIPATYLLARIYNSRKYPVYNEDKAQKLYTLSYYNFTSALAITSESIKSEDINIDEETRKFNRFKLDYLNYHLGKMSDRGLGCEINYIDAADFYSECRETNAYAQYALANIYLGEKTTPLTHDIYHNALLMLKKISAKMPYAAYQYAQNLETPIYADAAGTPSAIYSYYNLALNGFLLQEKEDAVLDGNILYKIGKLYYDGKGCTKDTEKAYEYFLRSAEDKNKNAYFALGKICSNKTNEHYDPHRAEAYYLKAYEQHQPSYLKIAIADLYADSESDLYDIDKAIGLYKDCIDNDSDASAMFKLGALYLQGNDKMPANIKLGLKYLNDAIEHGNQYAKIAIADFYANPENDLYDINKAIELYKDCAENNANSYSMYKLGCIYLFGRGVERDEALGLQYLNDAVERGNKFAAQTIEFYKNTTISTAYSLAYHFLSMITNRRNQNYLLTNHAARSNSKEARIDAYRKSQEHSSVDFEHE